MSKTILNNIHVKELNALVDKYNIKLPKNRIRSRKFISSITFNSINFGKFIVIDRYKNPNKQKYTNFYTVKFIDTNYIVKNIAIKEIRTGSIKDLFYRSVCNIGYLGEEYINLKKYDKKLYKCLYNRWTSMISRCYNKNDPKYNLYGNKGVHVSDSWLNFSNYCYDVINLPSFNRDLVLSGKLTLDKDSLQLNCDNKLYSKETCAWLDMKSQAIYVNHELAKESYKKYITRIYDNGKIEIFKGIRKYSRDNNLSYSRIKKCINNHIMYKNSYFRVSTKEEIEKYNKKCLN